MRENVRDRERLEHMVEAIDRILAYATGKTREELEADNLKYYGIVKNIEIVGEAAYKLTNAFCRQHPGTPWNHITRMRHVLCGNDVASSSSAGIPQGDGLAAVLQPQL